MTDSSVQIRMASPADRDTVTRVFHESGLDTDATLADGTTYWVMERGGQPVGAIGLEHGEGASLLRGAAVLPEARGGGLGRRLVMSAVEYAQGRGDRAIYMFSKGGDWGTFGFQQVPLAVVMGDVPDAPQVQAYRARGDRPGGTTWMRTLG
ncbi:MULTISPECIES: GNAT family N-acetyltransferase [unclassified Deinococcus]|uniref:GNAT family N-acetyltransferase n=1 Tax=unclassified Deinococcus TaxID=2623546 RepID=UPI000992E3D2|nr:MULTISPECIES: GNAT family N-acetyltransferase [unclassified Deinococcus]MCD0160349.1 GNAT family N-acetyltransferase [Deinococcus sp. 6YEL10]OOV14443.1 GNAT family N-acetyltransferase [Deinococcus sp. LM3]PIG98110.1 N-acetyltransferase [Deinococcus sp. UR1]